MSTDDTAAELGRTEGRLGHLEAEVERLRALLVERAEASRVVTLADARRIVELHTILSEERQAAQVVILERDDARADVARLRGLAQVFEAERDDARAAVARLGDELKAAHDSRYRVDSEKLYDALAAVARQCERADSAESERDEALARVADLERAPVHPANAYRDYITRLLAVGEEQVAVLDAAKAERDDLAVELAGLRIRLAGEVERRTAAEDWPAQAREALRRIRGDAAGAIDVLDVVRPL